MATVDSVDAFSLLQNMAPLSFDSSRLVDVACIAYSHVDHDYMTNLRKGFETSVKAQVQVTLPECTDGLGSLWLDACGGFQTVFLAAVAESLTKTVDSLANRRLMLVLPADLSCRLLPAVNMLPPSCPVPACGTLVSDSVFCGSDR